MELLTAVGTGKHAQCPAWTISYPGPSQSLNIPALLPASKGPSIIPNAWKHPIHSAPLSLEPWRSWDYCMTPVRLSSPCTSLLTVLLTLQQSILRSGADWGGHHGFSPPIQEVWQTRSSVGDVRGSGGLGGMPWVSIWESYQNPRPRVQDS